MIDKLKGILINTLTKNLKGYILISTVFLAGICLSCFLNISPGSEEEIKLYAEDFISNVKNYTTDSKRTFLNAFSGYIKTVFFLMICSFTLIGSAGVIFWTFLKGFSYGAVFTSLFSTVGTEAVLLLLSAVFPHILIVAPCFLMYGTFCMINSFEMLKGMKSAKKLFAAPLIYGTLAVALFSVASVIQAFIEPVLIRILN